jgi:hypothetical protein
MKNALERERATQMLAHSSQAVLTHSTLIAHANTMLTLGLEMVEYLPSKLKALSSNPDPESSTTN